MVKSRAITLFTYAIFLGIFAENGFAADAPAAARPAALQMPDPKNPAAIAAYECLLNPSSTSEMCRNGNYLRELSRASQLDDCKSEYNKFREATNKFASACGDAQFKGDASALFKNLGIDASDSESLRSNFHCAHEIEVCTSCATGDSALIFGHQVNCGAANPDQSLEGDDSSSVLNTAASSVSMLTGMGPGNSSRASDESGRRRYEEMKRGFLTCRPRSLEELREIRKEAKDAKKALRESQKEQSTLQNEIVTINQKRSDKFNTFADRAAEAQRRAEKGVEAIKESLEDNEKQVVANIMRMQADNDNIEADIRRLERTKIQAEVAFKEAEANLARGCHGMSLARVEKLRETLIQQAQQSQLSSGGFGQMMKSLGTNSRQRFQALAQKYYRECQQDRAYKSALQSAERAKQFARSTADDEVILLRQKQQTIAKQIQTMQSADRTSTLNRAYSRIETIRADLDRTLKQLDRDQNTMSQNSMQEMFAKMGEVTQKSADVAQDQAEYSWQQRLVDLDRQYGGGTAPKEGAVTKAFAEYRSVRTAASAAAGMCCQIHGQVTAARTIEETGGTPRVPATKTPSPATATRESSQLLSDSVVRTSSNNCEQVCAFPGLRDAPGSACPAAGGTRGLSGTRTAD